MPEDNPARKSLKLVLGAAGCAFVTPLTNKDKREYGHRCDQQDGEHDGPNQRRKRSRLFIMVCHRALLPPPALGERRHRGLARRRVAVRRRAIFVVPKIQRPHPTRTYRRRVDLQDAADVSAVGEHIVIVIVPC